MPGERSHIDICLSKPENHTLPDMYATVPVVALKTSSVNVLECLLRQLDGKFDGRNGSRTDLD